MSANLMDVSPGGQQTQYEGATHNSNTPLKKSGGQFGDPSEKTTNDPENTQERQQEKAEKKDQNIESVRQSATIVGQAENREEGQGDPLAGTGKKPGNYGGDVGRDDEM